MTVAVVPALAAPLSRRRFLCVASAAAAALWIRPARASAPARSLDGLDLESLSPFEREHLPRVVVPSASINGAKLPIVVELDHPMTPDHHVRAIYVLNRTDPVPSKGTFHLTPANGRAYVSLQARVHHGPSNITAIAECNRHGSFAASRTVVVDGGAGG